jgi:hypothetical protein
MTPGTIRSRTFIRRVGHQMAYSVWKCVSEERLWNEKWWTEVRTQTHVLRQRGDLTAGVFAPYIRFCCGPIVPILQGIRRLPAHTGAIRLRSDSTSWFRSYTPFSELYPAVVTNIFVFTQSFQASVGLYSQIVRCRSIPLHSTYSQITIRKHVIVTRRVAYASSRKAFDSVRCWCRDIGTQTVCIHRCSRFQEIRDRNFIGIVHRTMWRARFGPVVRQTTKWNECRKKYCGRSSFICLFFTERWFVLTVVSGYPILACLTLARGTDRLSWNAV